MLKWRQRKSRGRAHPVLTRSRGAFTLVEVVVACVIFAIGVLALQAAAVVVLRQSQDARSQARSAEIAAARFEAFAHTTCAEITAGSEAVRNVWSKWQTTALAGAEAGLSSQTIHFGRTQSPRSDSYLGAYRCR